MHDTQAQRWLPLAEAALELGISTDTARRRLRKHQLVGEQRPTPQGFIWWVCLGDAAQLGSAPSPHAAQVATTPMRPPPPGIVELVGLVDRLQRENRDLAGLVGALQERVGTLQTQLALAAPKEPASTVRPQTSDSEHVATAPPQTPAAQPQRAPWWMPWRRATS